MSHEDFVYMCMLLAAIPYGHIVKVSGSPARKKLLSFLAGVVVLLMTTGAWGALHSFFTILGTYAIVRMLGSRYGPWSAFIYIFSYLYFFRTCHWYGFAKPPPYSNAVQLLVTLRMCTIAFEGFQLNSQGPRKPTDTAESTHLTLKISIYDIFAYGYCYCGLLTGPYYRFVTYVDMLYQKNPEAIPSFEVAMKRMKYLPFYAAVYFPLNTYFPINHMLSPEYVNHPWGLLYRLAYLVPTFHWFRWRFYLGWLLAEASCITMGLGAYPEECKCKPGQGPTVEFTSEDASTKNVQKYNFETIHNINIYEIEFAPNMRHAMKNWNMTVQWWLAAYVHRKLPFKKYRIWVVLLVSAFWHGVMPGYYLCFMSVALVVAAETGMERVIQPWSNEKLQKVFNWINWFLLYRSFEYLGCSFMLLEIGLILKTWSHLYYCMHIVIVLFIVLSFLLPQRKAAENWKCTKVEVEPSKKDS